jgi:hypothetical protein
VTEWWWDKAYDHNPMNYPDHRPTQRIARVTDDTDPEMFTAANGQLRLRLRTAYDAKGQRRPKLAIFRGRLPWMPRLG